MKRKVFFMLIALLSVVSIVCSCNHKSGKHEPQTAEEIAASVTDDDVVWVRACINKMQTINYGDPDVFLQNLKQDRQNWKSDSIINSIPIQTLEQMCNIVYHKYATINKELVLKEYNESYSKVYKYLENSQPVTQIEKTDTTEVQ